VSKDQKRFIKRKAVCKTKWIITCWICC